MPTVVRMDIMARRLGPGKARLGRFLHFLLAGSMELDAGCCEFGCCLAKETVGNYQKVYCKIPLRNENLVHVIM